MGMSDERLLEVLEHVALTESIPDMTIEEEREVLGKHRLVWDWGRPYLQHLYWLTEEGESVFKKLKGE